MSTDDALAEKIRRATIESIRDLNNRISEAQAARAELIEQLQKDCPHPKVYRLPFKEGVILDRRPTLLCSVCKLQQEEWSGNSFLKSASNVEEMHDEDAFWKIRQQW
jgi:hypothetical protein